MNLKTRLVGFATVLGSMVVLGLIVRAPAGVATLFGMFAILGVYVLSPLLVVRSTTLEDIGEAPIQAVEMICLGLLLFVAYLESPLFGALLPADAGGILSFPPGAIAFFIVATTLLPGVGFAFVLADVSGARVSCSRSLLRSAFHAGIGLSVCWVLVIAACMILVITVGLWASAAVVGGLLEPFVSLSFIGAYVAAGWLTALYRRKRSSKSTKALVLAGALLASLVFWLTLWSTDWLGRIRSSPWLHPSGLENETLAVTMTVYFPIGLLASFATIHLILASKRR